MLLPTPCRAQTAYPVPAGCRYVTLDMGRVRSQVCGNERNCSRFCISAAVSRIILWHCVRNSAMMLRCSATEKRHLSPPLAECLLSLCGNVHGCTRASLLPNLPGWHLRQCHGSADMLSKYIMWRMRMRGARMHCEPYCLCPCHAARLSLSSAPVLLCIPSDLHPASCQWAHPARSLDMRVRLRDCARARVRARACARARPYVSYFIQFCLFP